MFYKRKPFWALKKQIFKSLKNKDNLENQADLFVHFFSHILILFVLLKKNVTLEWILKSHASFEINAELFDQKFHINIEILRQVKGDKHKKKRKNH